MLFHPSQQIHNRKPHFLRRMKEADGDGEEAALVFREHAEELEGVRIVFVLGREGLLG